ncbi:MAG: hypothetical protein GY822_23235 [Deltaproteobacteria bacterium]|nr:hypothetical protein [Deltaproteobacteria bacterium]
MGRLFRGLLAQSFAAGKKPKVSARLANDIKPLLVNMLASDPQRRPSLNEARQNLAALLKKITPDSARAVFTRPTFISIRRRKP